MVRAHGVEGARERSNATKGRRKMVLENEKEVEECVGGRESRTGDSEGSRREELLYVTVVLAVRCGRSRRCLLIYWCDSFRRRAAFPKWWPPRALWVPFNVPATTSRRTSVSPASVRAREKRRGKEEESEKERASWNTSRDSRSDGPARSLIFISDRRNGVTPRIKSRVIDGGFELVRYGAMTAAFVCWTVAAAVATIRPSSLDVPWWR